MDSNIAWQQAPTGSWRGGRQFLFLNATVVLQSMCPDQEIVKVTISTHSVFGHCADGGVWGQGILPPQNSFFEAADTVSVPLSSPSWTDRQQFPTAIRMKAFDRILSAKGIVGKNIMIAPERVELDLALKKDSDAESIAYFAWIRDPEVPTPSVPRSAPSCTPSTPPSSDPLWYCDQNTRRWVYNGTLTVGGRTTIVISATTQITGNLTLTSGSTISVLITSTGNNAPLINVSGCFAAQGSAGITVSLTDSQLKGLKPGTKVLLAESSCLMLLNLKAKEGQKGCKQYGVERETKETKEGRQQLFAVFKITKNTCNNWWIILVAVVGAVILLAIIAAILVFATPLRHKVLPYKDASKRRQAAVKTS